MSDARQEANGLDVVDDIARHVEEILNLLGADLSSPHLADTPRRVAKAWYYDLFRGLHASPPKITTFGAGPSQMIVLHDIPVRSMCAHHLLPFVGKAVVGYIPGNGKILGVSKLSRIVDHCARRPQVQENLTEDVADFLWELIGGYGDGKSDGGVGVLLRCNHMCMELRGVEHSGNMTTSALRGEFTEPEVRAEFLQLAHQKGFDP